MKPQMVSWTFFAVAGILALGATALVLENDLAKALLAWLLTSLCALLGKWMRQQSNQDG